MTKPTPFELKDLSTDRIPENKLGELNTLVRESGFLNLTERQQALLIYKLIQVDADLKSNVSAQSTAAFSLRLSKEEIIVDDAVDSMGAIFYRDTQDLNIDQKLALITYLNNIRTKAPAINAIRSDLKSAIQDPFYVSGAGNIVVNQKVQDDVRLINSSRGELTQKIAPSINPSTEGHTQVSWQDDNTLMLGNRPDQNVEEPDTIWQPRELDYIPVEETMPLSMSALEEALKQNNDEPDTLTEPLKLDKKQKPDTNHTEITDDNWWKQPLETGQVSKEPSAAESEVHNIGSNWDARMTHSPRAKKLSSPSNKPLRRRTIEQIMREKQMNPKGPKAK